MAGCDGWITLKVLELHVNNNWRSLDSTPEKGKITEKGSNEHSNLHQLRGRVPLDMLYFILSIFCIIYKRVTDDEANKLFYFLQKYSREWPLLNNITWEENGAIFTDVTYGGFVIIVIGLIIGQACGELQHHRKTENFFLIMGALMFISAGSLELAALDSVEERLVDNAAILGVISLLTGFVFILDLLLAGKRRKKYRQATIKKKTVPKTTQTEATKPVELVKLSDMNGNIQNGEYYRSVETYPKKIPRNAVKILPSSPVLDEIEVAPPIYSVNDLKTAEGRIKSTESFLRSEKGEYVRRSETPKEHILIPPGYVLMPVEFKNEEGKRDSVTPPGYASVITDLKTRPLKTPPGYVVVPIDQIETKNEDGRKLQSPTITTTLKTPNGYYHEDSSLGRTPQASLTNLSLSDLSDIDDAKRRHPSMALRKLGKYSPEYTESKPIIFNERADSRLSHKSLQDHYLPKGRLNHGFEEDLSGVPFRRNNSSRSSKPKSILRFDRIRLSRRNDDDSKDTRYDSLDSHKIAEDLRHLKEITKPGLDLENENEILKMKLRREKEESEKLKQDLKKQLEKNVRDSQRKKLEERINELEDIEKLLHLEKKVRELEERKMRELEDEKDRRMSEREEQYFGILDLKQSHRDSSPVSRRKLTDIEQSMGKHGDGEGAKKINEKLKEKIHEQEDKGKEDQEFRKVIDEGFYFLDEEEKRKKRAKSKSGSGKSSDGSEESPTSQMTDDEIRLRIETPGSYKSEAQVWLGSDGDLRKGTSSPPISPADPGFVLHTAQNWPDTPSPSPQDRFRFSAKKAQHLKISKTPSPETGDDEDDRKSEPNIKRGFITRKVDFTEVPVEEIPRPATVIGSTSSWKKWLQPKPKFQYTKSAPT